MNALQRLNRLAAPFALVAMTVFSGNASAAPLTDDARSALNAALDDEYHAEAVYSAVIEKFGAVRPFVNIIRAEQQHQAMLMDLFTSYGLEVPANPYLTGEKPLAQIPASIAESCAVGVAAEIANRDLYNVQLLPKVAGYGDITAVLEALRDASEFNHLPAFQRCANR
ncbi:MAG TPA: DUF2202 domain-containing protein [Devosiaceae bacterium]